MNVHKTLSYFLEVKNIPAVHAGQTVEKVGADTQQEAHSAANGKKGNCHVKMLIAWFPAALELVLGEELLFYLQILWKSESLLCSTLRDKLVLF